MAQELLITKGDTKPLGKNWTQKFLSRHNDIRTKFIPPLDKERALAQDSAILSTWFELFLRIKTEYKVEDEDIWNMDEKGVMLGVVPKLKVMISRHEKNKHMTQYGSHEWVSLLECISISGRALRSWIIFKAAVQQKAWNDAYPEAHISTSEKGWTDNEIYLWWIEKCFDKESAIGQKGEYRILCVDGYASHISTAAIEYCITRKIIVLCLPAHTTHLLQPLDVGVFGPLSIAYQNHVQRATRLGPCGSIDKTDFLELYRLAKQDAITSDNIKKAWSATGLSPFDPQIVLKHFPPLEKPEQYEQYNITIRPTSPPEGTITRISKDGESKITMTPANVLQVQRILHQAKAEGIELGDVVQKVSNAAYFVVAQHTIQNTTINELLELNKRKERKTNRAKGNWGNSRVLNQEVVDQRKKDAADVIDKKRTQHAVNECNKEERGLRALGPNIFAQPRPPVTPRRRAPAAISSPPASLFRPDSPPLRCRRMIMILPVRVTTQELQQVRWAAHSQAQGPGQESSKHPEKQPWEDGNVSEIPVGLFSS